MTTTATNTSAQRKKTPSPRQRAVRGATDEKIAEGVFEVLRTRGFDGLTIEAVSAASGVAKTTIYRRYDDRIDLLNGVIESMDEQPPSDYAHTPAGLEQMLRDAYEQQRRTGGFRAAIGLVAAGEEQMEILRRRLVSPVLERLENFFSGAIESGVARPDADPRQLLQFAVGGMLLASVHEGELEEDWIPRAATQLGRILWRDAP